MLVIWGMLNFSVASGRVALHFGNIGQAYKDYGVAYCFANSLLNTGIDKPDGYDIEAVDQLESEEQTQAEVPKTIEGRYPNIIMLQLESLLIRHYGGNNPVQGDPIPMFHFLNEIFHPDI
ncbi:MAG: hypothetical protein ACLUD2_17980 [Clostridium sp.]